MQFKLVLEGYLVWKLLFHVSGDLFDETKFVISFDFDFSGPIHRIFFVVGRHLVKLLMKIRL